MASDRLLYAFEDVDTDDGTRSELSEQTTTSNKTAHQATSWPGISNRSSYTTRDTIKHIWEGLGLPAAACENIELPEEDQHALPSSFKIGHLAQATIALSALAARLVHAQINHEPAAARRVTVPLKHAAVEFGSEQHYLLNNQPPQSSWGPIGGLHRTADGYVRVHDNFANHRIAACSILGLDPGTATRDEVAEKMLKWKAVDLEKAAIEGKAVIFALRSYREWAELQHDWPKSDDNLPVTVVKETRLPYDPFAWSTAHLERSADRCLRGLRVLELSRVIAAPVAGKTLAAHGADVLWVTSPNLPSLPALDIDVGRGKRTIQLDLDNTEDRKMLRRLVQDADVFIQSYRPKSLAARGLGPYELSLARPGLIYASLSAWWPHGNWRDHNMYPSRGFDSMVQTVSGMNVSEAEHYGDPSVPARPMPVQALDHAAGYLLATGISAALYKRATEGGSWEVDVTLEGVMRYLRSLGQYPGREGFDCQAPDPSPYLESRTTDFGELRAVKHSASIEGKEPGWDTMPKSLGSDEAEWL